jgi:hypothetical protein
VAAIAPPARDAGAFFLHYESSASAPDPAIPFACIAATLKDEDTPVIAGRLFLAKISAKNREGL